jgi:hypothetical protein
MAAGTVTPPAVLQRALSAELVWLLRRGQA